MAWRAGNGSFLSDEVRCPSLPADALAKAWHAGPARAEGCDFYKAQNLWKASENYFRTREAKVGRSRIQIKII